MLHDQSCLQDFIRTMHETEKKKKRHEMSQQRHFRSVQKSVFLWLFELSSFLFSFIHQYPKFEKFRLCNFWQFPQFIRTFAQQKVEVLVLNYLLIGLVPSKSVEMLLKRHLYCPIIAVHIVVYSSLAYLLNLLKCLLD